MIVLLARVVCRNCGARIASNPELPPTCPLCGAELPVPVGVPS